MTLLPVVLCGPIVELLAGSLRRKWCFQFEVLGTMKNDGSHLERENEINQSF